MKYSCQLIANSMSISQLFESNNLNFESTRLEHGQVPNSKLFEEAKTDSENVDKMVIIFAHCLLIACEGALSAA